MTALLVLLGGCALPNCSPKLTTSATTPTPSPSPTPTAPLQASTAPFHAGEVGVAYTPVALAANGGVQPYTWTITTGALPDGLNLGSDGSVSGTPTRAGGFSFTIQLADAGGSATALPATIAIAASPAASLVAACARYCSVEVGCVDVCGSFGSLSGGTGPYTYALQPGGLVPVGTHLNNLSLAGTFTQRAQFWQFTVVVTDALGQTASITPTFYVYPHVSLASGSCQLPDSWFDGCKMKLPYTGGTPGGTPSVKVTAVNITNPSGASVYQGLTVSASGGYVYVTIPGSNPAYGNGLDGTLTLVLTDQSPCGSGPTNCSSAPATETVQVQGN